MNLHEECLLKYLLNPIDLDKTTNLLKVANELVSKGKFNTDILVKTKELGYTAIRI